MVLHIDETFNFLNGKSFTSIQPYLRQKEDVPQQQSRRCSQKAALIK